MTISASTLRRLDLLSVVILVIAAALYVWPVRLLTPKSDAALLARGVPSLPVASDTPGTQDDAMTDARRVVNANILSGSRRAPTRRYVSPELATAPEFTMPAAFVSNAESTAQGATEESDKDAVPAFYGTVNSDGTWRALLRLSNDDANPRLFKEGDRRGSYRVVSIRANAVVVAGPSGQQTLRLAAAPRGDSIGKQP